MTYASEQIIPERSGLSVGKPVEIGFSPKNSRLDVFRVSPERTGASHGYVAAGGPGFAGPVDAVGLAALEGGR